jgi:hypothetical protein
MAIVTMHIIKKPMAFVAVAALIGAITLTSSTPAAIAKTIDSRQQQQPQEDSLIHWISTAQSTNEYTTFFRTEDCTFNSTGRNPFFILEPNYQLTLAGEEEGERVELTITVLNETREINGTETRVIEERETSGGELVEVSRNFFAMCEETNSVFYFGEEVDEYENGAIVGHEGGRRAGEGANRPGIIMPGTILLGSRYHQEIAPNVAMDRAEIINMGQAIQTPSGEFTDTLITQETTPLEPDVVELKYYAAGVGQIQEEDLKLEKYGFIK